MMLFTTILIALAAGLTNVPPQGELKQASITEQARKVAQLSMIDGEWRGTATTFTPRGPITHVQTERAGPLLDGSIRVVEGRGYDRSGATVFNALGVIHVDAATGKLMMHSHAAGKAGLFEINLTGKGYVWEIPAGPASIRYTATIEGGRWHEIGERIVPGRPPMKFFEMDLRKIGEGGWPAASPVPHGGA